MCSCGCESLSCVASKSPRSTHCPGVLSGGQMFPHTLVDLPVLSSLLRLKLFYDSWLLISLWLTGNIHHSNDITHFVICLFKITVVQFHTFPGSFCSNTHLFSPTPGRHYSFLVRVVFDGI